MANKRTQKKNKRHNNLRKKSQRNQHDTYQRGGTFSVPISKFYPQNMYETDPSRMMSVGGSRKNHSRKYLKRKTGNKKIKIIGGNSGFFSQFGSMLGSNQTAQQITGISLERPIEATSFKV
jgi:hypothetical protein